jgi:hypothetical protein
VQNDPDLVIAQILHADDDFLAEVGRLTLLFSRIEDCLAHDALELLVFSSDKAQESSASTSVEQLRIMEKRDLLKRVAAEIGRFYGVDHSRLTKVLDELGNINRLRRTIVHGWIRWSVSDEGPVLVDSHGQSVPAWPADVLDLNLKLLDWIRKYYAEQLALMEGVLSAYDAKAEKLLQHSKAPPHIQALLRNLKRGISEP